MQAQRCPMVRPFFTKGVRQSRQTSDLHPHSEILSLNVGCANLRRVRISKDGFWDGLHNFTRTVPLFAFTRRCIDLDQHSVIDAIQQRVIDGVDVGLEAVRGDLESLRRSRGPQAFDKNIRCGFVPATQSEVQNQFRFSLDSNESVRITDGVVVGFLRALVGFFLPDESPQLVTLHVRYGNVADQATHDGFAFFAGHNEQLENRSVVHSSNALDAGNGAALDQQFEHIGCLVQVGVHALQFFMGFREGTLALAALIPPQAIAVFTEFTTFGSATVANHSGLAFHGQKGQNDSGSQNPAFGASPRLIPTGSDNCLWGVLLLWSRGPDSNGWWSAANELPYRLGYPGSDLHAFLFGFVPCFRGSGAGRRCLRPDWRWRRIVSSISPEGRFPGRLGSDPPIPFATTIWGLDLCYVTSWKALQHGVYSRERIHVDRAGGKIPTLRCQSISYIRRRKRLICFLKNHANAICNTGLFQRVRAFVDERVPKVRYGLFADERGQCIDRLRQSLNSAVYFGSSEIDGGPFLLQGSQVLSGSLYGGFVIKRHFVLHRGLYTMRKPRAREILHNVQSTSGWQTVVTDCESEIARAKHRIRSLRASMAIAKEKLRLGEPFPGEMQSTQS
jgi:hypothetical protein